MAVMVIVCVCVCMRAYVCVSVLNKAIVRLIIYCVLVILDNGPI